MSDVIERLRNVAKSNEGRIGLSVVSVTLRTVTDAVGEIERLGRCNEQIGRTYSEMINQQNAEITRLQSLSDVQTGMSWMRSCDELTAECFRHKAEIELLRYQLAAAEGTVSGMEIETETLYEEIERLQADIQSHKLASIGMVDAGDVQAAEQEADRLRGEVERLKTALAESEETAVRRWRVANNQLTELSRLRKQVATLSAPALLAETAATDVAYHANQAARLAKQVIRLELLAAEQAETIDRLRRAIPVDTLQIATGDNPGALASDSEAREWWGRIPAELFSGVPQFGSSFPVDDPPPKP